MGRKPCLRGDPACRISYPRALGRFFLESIEGIFICRVDGGLVRFSGGFLKALLTSSYPTGFILKERNHVPFSGIMEGSTMESATEVGGSDKSAEFSGFCRTCGLSTFDFDVKFQFSSPCSSCSISFRRHPDQLT